MSALSSRDRTITTLKNWCENCKVTGNAQRPNWIKTVGTSSTWPCPRLGSPCQVLYLADHDGGAELNKIISFDVWYNSRQQMTIVFLRINEDHNLLDYILICLYIYIWYVLLLPGLVHLRPTLNLSPLRLIHARCYNIHHGIPGLPYLRSFSQRSLPCWAHRNRWDSIYSQRKTPDLPKSFPSLSDVHMCSPIYKHGNYQTSFVSRAS